MTAKNEFQDILEGWNLKAKRLVIQDIEKSEGIINYGAKRYLFIPLNSREIIKIENNIIEIKKQKNRFVMTLNEEPLIDEDKLNEICYDSNDIKKDNNSSKHSEIFSNRNSSINISLNSSQNNSYKKSKKDNSSEKDGITGERFYKVHTENKYTRYTFLVNFEKEVDGVYCKHKMIKLK